MIITNKLCLPQPFVDAASSDYVYLPKRYSVTTVLNKGVMQMMLERRYADKITEDAADLVWAIFGTAVHSILENSKETDTQIKENKISVPVGNGYTISGIFDLYDDASGTVVDYKTTSAWKIVHNELDDYRMQILAYAWMLRQIGFDAIYRINADAMDAVRPRLGDAPSLDDLLALDEEARAHARRRTSEWAR